MKPPNDPVLNRMVVTTASFSWIAWIWFGSYNYLQSVEPHGDVDWSIMVWKHMVPSTLMTFAVCALDLLLLQSTHHALHTAKSAGFSTFSIWGQIIFNLLLLNPVMMMCFYLVRGEMTPYWDWYLAAKVVFVFIGSDCVFFLMHRHMHRHWAAPHIFHHCVHYPSFTSNFFFNPIDFLLEVGSAALVFSALVLGLPFSPLRDGWALFVMIMVQTIWYVGSHDSTLQLQHYNHHRSINGNYWIYNVWRDYRRDDQEMLGKAYNKLIAPRTQSKSGQLGR